MPDTTLFLGFALSESYQKELAHLPAIERELFIQKHPSLYLQEIESDGTFYLGKCLGPLVEFSTLEASQSHILSLLKKLIPSFPYEQYPLLLLALPLQLPE